MTSHVSVGPVARAFGDVSGPDLVVCPGPRHGRHDRSLSVRLHPNAPAGK